MYRRLANLYVGMTRDFQRTAERSLNSLVHPSAPEDVRDELVGMSVRVGPQAYVRQNLAVIARSDLRPVLSTIDIPTIVVVGKEDRVTPVHLSCEIQNLVPESKLHVIPDCGHLPPIEKPHEVAALLSAFITPRHQETVSESGLGTLQGTPARSRSICYVNAACKSAMSRFGGVPNIRVYSRLNCETLSYPTR